MKRVDRAVSPRIELAALAAAFVLVSLVDTAAYVVRFGMTRPALESVTRTAWALALDGAFGLTAALAFTLISRAVGRIAACALVGLGLALVVIPDNLERASLILFDGRHETTVFAACVAVVTLAFTLLPLAANKLGAHALLRGLGFLVLVGAAVANECFLVDDYFPIHNVVAIGITLILASLLTPSSRYALMPSRMRLFGIALVCVAPWILHPSHPMRRALFRTPVTVGAWTYATFAWRLPQSSQPPVEVLPASASLRPTSPPLFETPRIVVLITVDALRGDVIADPRNDARWPTIARIKNRGAQFSRARAPGSNTALTLTSLFTSRYYSELNWAPFGRGPMRFSFPAADPAIRFPALLSAASVRTVKISSLSFLMNAFGVATGFAEDPRVVDDRRHAWIDDITTPLLAELAKPQPAQGALYYIHLLEPHSPYDRHSISENAPAFERYLEEISTLDRHLAPVIEALERPPLEERALIIFTADHGEAFGEHGTFEHGKVLYDELLRVPLIFYGGGIKARTIDEPVSLVDLGPTLLDLFSVDRPAAFHGESLVPSLRGDTRPLVRPIFAETRTQRALVTRDDVKVIVDGRRKTVEAYDLARDPRELDDIFALDARAMRAVATLNGFFSPHR